MSIINEPGLYSLVLRSRKPEAKAFKRWVTHEVLPAIRKAGRYEAAPAPPTPAPASDAILAVLTLMREEQIKLSQRLAAIETAAAVENGVAKYRMVRRDPVWPEAGLEAESLSVGEAARALNTDWKEIVRLCEAGELEFFRKGPKRRIVTASLLRHKWTPGRTSYDLAPTRQDLFEWLDGEWRELYRHWAEEIGVARSVTVQRLLAFVLERDLLSHVFEKAHNRDQRLHALELALGRRVGVKLDDFAIEDLGRYRGERRFSLAAVT